MEDCTLCHLKQQSRCFKNITYNQSKLRQSPTGLELFHRNNKYYLFRLRCSDCHCYLTVQTGGLLLTEDLWLALKWPFKLFPCKHHSYNINIRLTHTTVVVSVCVCVQICMCSVQCPTTKGQIFLRKIKRSINKDNAEKPKMKIINSGNISQTNRSHEGSYQANYATNGFQF